MAHGSERHGRRVTGERRARAAVVVGLALVWCAAGAILALWFAGRIRDWSVMTDELQYAKLALSIAESGSPLPSLRGTTVSLANQLYPLLLAPIYGSLSAPDAFRAAHVLNAVVMTSSVVPAYLIGRELLPRAWSFAVAVLAVVTPWIVLTGFVMSEVVAYPAFLWAMLAFHRAVAAPSPRRDLLAALALGVSVLARTQFAALALVLPLAILGHEAGRALASPGRDGRWTGLVAGVRAAAAGHRALWAVYAGAALAAAVVSLAGYRLFGAYSTTLETGSLLPSGVWESAVRHLDVVGIGCGLVPLLLGGGWILATLVRPERPERHAFATLTGLTVAVLAVETASFDLRFGGPDVIRDRYLFYVVPLLLVASAAALTERRRGHVAVGTAGVAVLVAATVPGLPFTTFPGVSVDSPVSLLNETLIEHSGTLATGTFVAATALLVGAVLALALVLAPRAPTAVALFAALLAFSGYLLHGEVDRILTGTALSGRPLAEPPGVVLDWVDSVVPEGEQAGIVPFPISTAWGISAILWWDVEFWNHSVTRSYGGRDGNFTYAPFPDERLVPHPVTGVVEGTSDAPAYLVVAPGDPRFGLEGREHAVNVGLRVLAVERPYRAVWSTRGLRTDGWTFPGLPAVIRVHAPPTGTPSVERLRITLRAPDAAEAGYRISGEGGTRAGAVAAGASTEEVVEVCVGPGAPADVTVTSTTAARVDGAPLSPEIGAQRLVGVAVGAVAVEPTRRACEAG